MSRRWPVYQAAQAKRAEDQKAKDEALHKLLSDQARALSKGRSNGIDEVPGEQEHGGNRHGPEFGQRAAQNPDRDKKVQPVPRGRPKSVRKNVVRESTVGA